MWEVGLIIVGIFFLIAGFAVLSVIMLARPRNMREDPNREGGEFSGHIDVNKWNKQNDD